MNEKSVFVSENIYSIVVIQVQRKSGFYLLTGFKSKEDQGGIFL